MNTAHAYDNPFTPSFGEVPRYLVGRDAILVNLIRAFDAETLRSPFLSTLITGPRGTGKTALMSYAAEQAALREWIPVHVTASHDMLADIYEQTVEAASYFLEPVNKREVTGVSIGSVGVQWRFPENSETTWRTKMAHVLDELAQHDLGLLICIDEINPELEEIDYFAQTYQLFVTEHRKVGLLMAGLPRKVSRLIAGDSTSFLRRAQKISLGRVSNSEVRKALSQTLEEAGKTIADSSLDAAAQAVEGYPYMIQLVGYHMWEQSRNASKITSPMVDAAVKNAQEGLVDQILGPTYYELSDGDRAFLHAMSQLELPTELGAIAKELDRGNSYTAQYKVRLLEAGVIGESYDRLLDFELPGMQDFVMQMKR